MKKIILLLTAVFFVALISSCSDDKSTSPEPEQGKGFPLAEGNFWKYSTFATDASGNQVGEALESYTTTLGSKTTLDGKTAYEMISTKDEVGAEKSYISADDNGIYSYVNPVVDEEGGVTPGSWLKIADLKNMKWDIFTQVIDEEGEGYTQKGTVSLKGENRGTTKVTYKGKSYNATAYSNILSTDVTVMYLEGEEWKETIIAYKDTSNIVFIGGLGLYSTKNMDFSAEKSKNIDVLTDHNIK